MSVLSGRLLAVGALGLAAMVGAAAPAPNPKVALETPQGRIVVEVDTAHAPLTAANFLRYVDAGLYKGAAFYRVVRPDNDRNPATITVIQGGIGDGPSPLPTIPHETTRDTSLRHLDGTLSMARDEPGSASSEFFIVIGDAPALDFGGKRNADGQGFAAFGHVVEGMDVVRRINAGQASGGTAHVKSQVLDTPVAITAMARVGSR
jgi:peptidyl-prolyl cis-trans isomerase A (cyclophilin A)